MKRFLRSKLALTLAALLLLVSSIAVAMSGSILHSHAQGISITPTNITGQFFPNSSFGNGTFDVNPSTTPAFMQNFQAINFNPDPSTQNCTPSTGVDQSTRPFTDVYPSIANGSCPTVVAQSGNGQEQAGVNDLEAFEAVFTANVTVPSSGTLTSTITSDDGWILSIGSSNGQQPTPDPNNPRINPPGSNGPFTGYPEMGDNNQPSSPNAFTVVTNFPAAGTYPIELDYTECCGATLTLTMNNSFTPTPTPSPSPTLSPSPTPTPPPPPFIVKNINANCNNPKPVVLFDADTVVKGTAFELTTDAGGSAAEASKGHFLFLKEKFGPFQMTIKDFNTPHSFEFKAAENLDMLTACILPGVDKKGPDGDELGTIQIESIPPKLSHLLPELPVPIQCAADILTLPVKGALAITKTALDIIIAGHTFFVGQPIQAILVLTPAGSCIELVADQIAIHLGGLPPGQIEALDKCITTPRCVQQIINDRANIFKRLECLSALSGGDIFFILAHIYCKDLLK